MLTSRIWIDIAYALIFVVALVTVVHDVSLSFRRRELITASDDAPAVRWRTGIAFVVLAWLPILIAVLSGGF